MRHVESFAEGRPDNLSGLLREAESWAGALSGAMNDLQQERLEGTDPSGAVRAVVSGGGRLRALTIDPRLSRDLDHLRLAQAVLDAIAAAHATMGERLEEVIEGLSVPGAAGSAADPLEGYIRNVLKGE